MKSTLKSYFYSIAFGNHFVVAVVVFYCVDLLCTLYSSLDRSILCLNVHYKKNVVVNEMISFSSLSNTFCLIFRIGCIAKRRNRMQNITDCFF